jgi:hypothetical protein
MSRTLTVLLLVPGLSTLALVDASAAVCHTQSTVMRDPVTQVLTYKVEKDCAAGVTPGAPYVSGSGEASGWEGRTFV